MSRTPTSGETPTTGRVLSIDSGTISTPVVTATPVAGGSRAGSVTGSLVSPVRPAGTGGTPVALRGTALPAADAGAGGAGGGVHRVGSIVSEGTPYSGGGSGVAVATTPGGVVRGRVSSVSSSPGFASAAAAAAAATGGTGGVSSSSSSVPFAGQVNSPSHHSASPSLSAPTAAVASGQVIASGTVVGSSSGGGANYRRAASVSEGSSPAVGGNVHRGSVNNNASYTGASGVSAVAAAAAHTPVPPAAPPPTGPTATQSKLPRHGFSAGESVPMMLPAPLSIQATVLRQPEFFMQLLEPELVEEGDILFDVLQDPFTQPRRAAYVLEREEGEGTKDSTRTIDNKEGGQLRPARSLTERFYRGVTRERAAQFGLQAHLSMPSSIGSYARGERFRALLSFFNSAPYPLSSIDLQIDGVSPLLPVGGAGAASASPPQQQQQTQQTQQTQRETLLRRTLEAPLAPRACLAVVASQPLVSAGPHALSVLVRYRDPAGEPRRLTWGSTVQAGAPLLEDAPRRLQVVSLPLRETARAHSREGAANGGGSAGPHQDAGDGALLSLEAAAADLRLPTTALVLTVGLRNAFAAPLSIQYLRLMLPDGGAGVGGGNGGGGGGFSPFGIMRSSINFTSAASGGGRRAKSSAFVKEPIGGGANGGSDAPQEEEEEEDDDDDEGYAGVLMPGDTVSATFELVVRPEALRRAHHSHHSNSGGSDAGGLLGTHPVRLGELEWAWRRPRGDGGMMRSSPIEVGRLAPPADMQLLVTGAEPDPEEGEEGEELVLGAAAEGSTSSATAMNTRVASSRRRSANNSNNVATSSSSQAASGAFRSPRCMALRACEPVTVRCVLLYYSPTASVPVAVKIRAERLAPHWLYAGPATRPLGRLQPGSATEFSLTLLPWRRGWLPLCGLEIVVDHPGSGAAEEGGGGGDQKTSHARQSPATQDALSRIPGHVLWPPSDSGINGYAAVGARSSAPALSATAAGGTAAPALSSYMDHTTSQGIAIHPAAAEAAESAYHRGTAPAVAAALLWPQDTTHRTMTFPKGLSAAAAASAAATTATASSFSSYSAEKQSVFSATVSGGTATSSPLSARAPQQQQQQQGGLASWLLEDVPVLCEILVL